MGRVYGREGMNPHSVTSEATGKEGVHQTRHGGADLDELKRGNCFVACLATILGLTIEEVPDEVAAGEGWDGITAWLLERGWYILGHEHDPLQAWVPGYSIMGVASMHKAIREETEGGGHVVVAKDGVPWFNPNPDDERDCEQLLLSAQHSGNCVSYVLYPLDPEAPRPIPSASLTTPRPG